MPVKKPVLTNEASSQKSDSSTSKNSSSETLACDGAINLGTELTIKNVSELKQRIDDCLANESVISLNPADLQRVDASGLQMLYSLQKSLTKSSQQLHWSSRNPVLDSAAELIGMGNLLDASNAATSDQGQDQGFGFF